MKTAKLEANIFRLVDITDGQFMSVHEKISVKVGGRFGLMIQQIDGF